MSDTGHDFSEIIKRTPLVNASGTDRFRSPVPLPTPREREILVCLIEECGEVIQRATKLIRFGALEAQPGQPLSNSRRLSMEIGDLVGMIEEAQNAGLVDGNVINEYRAQKKRRFLQYAQSDEEQR